MQSSPGGCVCSRSCTRTLCAACGAEVPARLPPRHTADQKRCSCIIISIIVCDHLLQGGVLWEETVRERGAPVAAEPVRERGTCSRCVSLLFL